MTGEQSHGEDHEVRLLVRAKPLGRAEELDRRLVEEVQRVEGVLELDADPAWSGAIATRRSSVEDASGHVWCHHCGLGPV